jgi:chemotaxis protein MotB
MKRWLMGALAVVTVAGCGIKEDVYKKDTGVLKDQIAGLETEKGQCVADRGKLQGEKEILLAKLSALGGEKSALSDNLKQALAKMEELKAQAEKRRAKLAELKGKLQSMVAAGQLKIRTDKGRMIVEMAEKVLFDSGSFKLKAGGLETLAQLTGILKTIEGRAFQVGGHTDDVGADEMNWTLSLNRARAVVLYMIEMGMPAERLSAAGYGKFQPVAPNDTPEGKAQNRRIEIALVPNIEEILGFGNE